MTTRLRRVAACTGLLVLLFASTSEAAVRHIVLLQSLERGNLTLDYFTGSFRVALDQGATDPVKVTQFVVQLSGFDEIPEQAIIDYLRAAFTNRPDPDLVMTIGGPAAAFARKHRLELFPKTPLLFAAVDQRFLQGSPLATNETAVAVLNDMPGVVEDILRLFPQTSNVFMLSGPGPLGQFWHRELERDFQRFETRVKFIWADESSLAGILRRVASLPPNSAIFYVTFGTDDEAGAYSEDRVLAAIHSTANAPLFAGQGPLLGHGILGGRLLPIDELGRVAADVALRIMKGESPASVKTPVQQTGPPVFDGRELQRWGISESLLPPGSVVRFREPGVWDRFKWVIIGGSLVVIAQAFLIGALLINRVKRRRAEQGLRQHLADLDTARGALSNLSRRLMGAQEQERTRVARELHDQVGQRMAFLAMDVGRLRQTIQANDTDAQVQTQGVYDAVIELARDVQGISHRLHSSRIDLLGLAAAAGDLCREVSSHQGLQVEYVQDEVPSSLPEGVAISVFRVLQEALSNAVKHSHARHCKVTLQGLPDALKLEVTDDGRGFDAGAMGGERDGLGLISMQERLKLVNGDLAVESKVGVGTTVRGSVPLRMRPEAGAHAESASVDREAPSITA
jgi:signal transduction histidine kinase